MTYYIKYSKQKESQMKCPECVKLGKSSTFHTNGGTFRTAAASGTPYWDEEGKMHTHDYNVSTSFYSCSEGHNLVRKYIQKCCAEFPGKDEWKLES
jgi:hypothetical protein